MHCEHLTLVQSFKNHRGLHFCVTASCHWSQFCWLFMRPASVQHACCPFPQTSTYDVRHLRKEKPLLLLFNTCRPSADIVMRPWLEVATSEKDAKQVKFPILFSIESFRTVQSAPSLHILSNTMLTSEIWSQFFVNERLAALLRLFLVAPHTPSDNFLKTWCCMPVLPTSYPGSYLGRHAMFCLLGHPPYQSLQVASHSMVGNQMMVVAHAEHPDPLACYHGWMILTRGVS